MTPEPLLSVQDPDWLRLRSELWPHCSAAGHLNEMASFVANPNKYQQFIIRGADRRGLGFVEASIRNDHVNGTSSSPVAFLEGLYVVREARGCGMARLLVAMVAEWALAKGCTELASDTQVENTQSQAVHLRLGFTEAERVVYFNMSLKRWASHPSIQESCK